jgi:hypothetical protein
MEDDLAGTNLKLAVTNVPQVRGQLVVQQLKNFYEDFSAEKSADKLELLDSLYTSDVEFRDPVHTLHGCLALRHYLRKMASNLKSYHISYLDEVSSNNSACLSWEMAFSHPMLNGGRLVTLRGMSQLKFTDKVFYHEDCYDLGALVYEQVPMLGWVIRLLKKNMAG